MFLNLAALFAFIFKKRHKIKKHGLITLAANLALIDYKLKTIIKNEKVANCTAGKNWIVLYPDGSFSYCELMKPIGNIRKNKLEKILHSKDAFIQRRTIKKCYCNHGCFIDYDSKLTYPYEVFKKLIEIKF